MRFLLSAAVFCVLAATGVGQIRKRGDRYQFRAQYVVGSTIACDLTTVVTPFGSGAAGGAVQKLTLPVVMRILEIKKPASAGGMKVAKIQSESGPIKLNGSPFRPKAVETVFVDELNRLQGTGGKEIPQFTTPLPEKPLRVGESWSAAIDPGDSLPMQLKVTARYRLLKVNRLFATIAIETSGKGTGTSKIATAGRGTMLLRVRDGTLEKVTMSQTVTASEGVGAKTAITVTRKV